MSYQTTLTLRGGPQSVEGDGTTVTPVTLGQPGAVLVVSMINTGLVGPPGPGASISADPDNRLTTGSDDGLYVPEIVIDPLAYYILAKA